MVYPEKARRTFFAVLAVFAVLATLLTAPAQPAHAGTARTAKVIHVLDGDTVRVRFKSDGKVADVRFLGVDTPEKDGCGYTRAKNYVDNLLMGRVVTVRADVATSADALGRIHRRITFSRSGTTVDATAEVLRRGLGVWSPNHSQPTAMQRYHRLSEAAAAKGYGMFKWNRCSSSPAPAASPSKIQFDVQWKDDVHDKEHARITNNSGAPIDFDNWGLRAGGIRLYKIPSGPAIAHGETLRVYVGKGTNSELKRFLGRDGDGRMWSDIDINRPDKLGEGGYLLDPRGDIRAYQIWGCLRCGEHPAQGKLTFLRDLQSPHNPGPYGENMDQEYVVVTNTSSSDVFAGRLLVDIQPFTVELPPNLWLEPGGIIKVVSGEQVKNVTGAEGPLFDNPAGTGNQVVTYYLNSRKKKNENEYFELLYSDDVAVLRTYHGVRVACYQAPADSGGNSLGPCPPSPTKY